MQTHRSPFYRITIYLESIQTYRSPFCRIAIYIKISCHSSSQNAILRLSIISKSGVIQTHWSPFYRITICLKHFNRSNVILSNCSCHSSSSLKVAQIFGNPFGLFWKIKIVSKICCGTFLDKFGPFLSPDYNRFTEWNVQIKSRGKKNFSQNLKVVWNASTPFLCVSESIFVVIAQRLLWRERTCDSQSQWRGVG